MVVERFETQSPDSSILFRLFQHIVRVEKALALIPPTPTRRLFLLLPRVWRTRCIHLPSLSILLGRTL